MKLNRALLVAVVCGSVASVATAGPRDPKVGVAKTRAKNAGQLQPLAAAPNGKQEPINYVKVRRMPDGRIIGIGPVTPYRAPAGASDAPTQNAFDICQFDATTGAPIGGECANPAAPNATTRWWFGAANLNPHFANDFVMDAAAIGKPIDRIDIAWSWGVGVLRPMWIGVFIADTFNSCATGVPATSGPVDGVAYQFADSAGAAGYNYTNIGLPPDPAEGILAPADGNGAYELAFGAFDIVTEIFTLDATPGTQPMLWDKNDVVNQLGTQTLDQWDDDTPLDGLFGVGECYAYGPFAIPCPATGILGGMIAFWVDPAGGGGCYANCDGSTGTPALTANDFQCFLNKYAANDPFANCDGSTGTPALTANDFQCFLNKYAGGCS